MSTAFDALTGRLSKGVLAFPATAFDSADGFDVGITERHVAQIAAHRPVALVPAGGAGEVFSLSATEHEALVQATVRAASGVPVIAGVGGGLGCARQTARAAERAGADGILILPPYLITGEQEGLESYVRGICTATALPALVYSRDNGVFNADTVMRLADTCRNLIGLKDGMADFETVLEVRDRAADRLVLINGVPTAEILASQYFSVGITSYSSAVFSFYPELALTFHAAVAQTDRATVDRLLRDFYLPLARIRRRRRGYAVAIIKAGLDAVGRPVGAVRAPLVDLKPEERRELALLMEGVAPFVASKTRGD